MQCNGMGYAWVNEGVVLFNSTRTLIHILVWYLSHIHAYHNYIASVSNLLQNVFFQYCAGLLWSILAHCEQCTWEGGSAIKTSSNQTSYTWLLYLGNHLIVCNTSRDGASIRLTGREFNSLTMDRKKKSLLLFKVVNG